MFVHPPAKLPSGPETADIQGMRTHNAELVLRRVWTDSEGISRADLSRDLGLSRSTISAIVEGLLGRGLILESHRARSSGGRRPIVLKFNHDFAHLIGIDLGASHVTVLRTDLRARPVERRSISWDVQSDPHGALNAVHQMMTDLVGPEAPPLLAIGVGVPCPVDASQHDQLSVRILPAWEHVRPAAWLYARWGVPVFVDNDANLGALAEAWWGEGRGVAHFSYIKVGTGIGAGHLIDGQNYRGSSGIAGEIGHTTVAFDGRPCRCGLNGCLEAEIGSPALLAKARQALAAGRRSTLSDAEPLDLGAIIDHAKAGDALATEVVTEAGHHLGVAVANLLNLLNPGQIVLGGRLTAAGDLLLAPLRETVQDRALWTSIERAEITLGALGQDNTAVGAATLVLQAALAKPELFHAAATQVARSASARLQRVSS